MYPLHFIGYQLGRSVKHLILHVTSRCNRRCRHCFVDFSNPQDLPLDTCRDIARDIGKLLWLDIGGGEPFLRDDLPDIVAAFDADVVMIPTNGSLGNKAVDQIRTMRGRTRAQVGISLSLDGLKDTNDAVRGKNSWDEAWDSFEKFRGVDGLPVKINTVLTSRNAGEIPDLMNEVRKKNPDFHSIILLRGDPADPSAELPPLAELRRLMPKILKMQASYDYGKNPMSARFLRGYHRRMWEVSLDTVEQRTQVIPCFGGQAHAIVWADGSVSSCEMLPVVGNVKDRPLAGILTSPEFAKQAAGIRRKACFCTHNCAMLDSILLSPREMTRLAGRFIRSNRPSNRLWTGR